MAEYIGRQAAIDAVGDVHPLDYNSQAIVYRLKSLPSADVEPVRHGRWMVNKCSVCGFLATEWVGRCHYCPNCGARMDGEQVV